MYFRLGKFIYFFKKIQALFPLGIGPKFGPENSLEKSLIHQQKYKVQNSGSIPRNACVTCETQLCVTTKKVWQTDRQTDYGRSDPYVPLCFAGDTKMILSQFFVVGWIFNRLEYTAIPPKGCQDPVKHKTSQGWNGRISNGSLQKRKNL